MKRFAPALFIILAAPIICTQDLFAQLNEGLPDELQDLGVVEKLGDYVPMQAVFADVNGDSVTLGSLIKQGKPVILNPMYFECPMLCGLVVDGLIDVIEDLEWQPGKEYIIISFSIDSEEDYKLAAEYRQKYLAKLKKTDAENGWYFLTGNKSQIDAVVESIGYKYAEIKGTDEFAHSAALTMLSPEGKITRYLYGIKYKEFDVRNALYESADGKVGTTLEKLVMYCYRYDPDSNTYAPLAINIMKLGGVATLIFLGIFIALLWVRDLNKKKQTSNT